MRISSLRDLYGLLAQAEVHFDSPSMRIYRRAFKLETLRDAKEFVALEIKRLSRRCSYCEGTGSVDKDGNVPGTIQCPECKGGRRAT